MAMTVAAFLLLACTGLLFAVLYLRQRGRLRDFRARIRAQLAHPATFAGRDPLAGLAADLRGLREELGETRHRLQEETALRERAEAALRESEERYALAVRGANDGMWEWDLKTDRVHYSPRWKGLLGYAESELAPQLDEWTLRIHPDDRERVLADLQLHLDGRTARFGSEHRLQHRDGGWRWVLARACAVRRANGKASRVVGLITDISTRKRAQEILLELAEGFTEVHGDDCLRRLVRSFAQALGVQEAFVCECCDAPATRVRMLARWKGDQYERCVEFDLAGTACEDVVHAGQLLYCPRDAGERWPLERQYERESYLGIPCLDTEGRVIGHIACADPGQMPDELPHQAILKLFAVRASVELERRRIEHERRALGMRGWSSSFMLH
jgi:PAS domain S-box-containing protein